MNKNYYSLKSFFLVPWKVQPHLASTQISFTFTIFIFSSCWGNTFVEINHLLKTKFMKTTIFLITLGLVSTTTFAQQSTVKVAEATNASSSIKAENTGAATGGTQNAAASVNATAGEAAKETSKIAQSTKSAAEQRLNQASTNTKNKVSNTNANVSVQAATSANAGDNNAVSHSTNTDVILQKNIKGADIVKTEQKLENSSTSALQKTGTSMKETSASSQSALKSNTNKISGKTIAARSTGKTALKTSSVNAAAHTRVMTGIK
jgi:hypothetical protein